MKSTPPAVVVRTLQEDDAAALRELRLRALRDEPVPFMTTYEEEAERTEQDFAARVRRNPDGTGVLGAFVGRQLVGMVGVGRQGALKARHRASIWGMYVVPEARRHGVGKALLDDAIDRLRALGEVEQVELTVVSSEEAARGLYVRAGFQQQGLIKRAMKVGRRYYDEESFVLWLRDPGADAPSHPFPVGLSAPDDDGAAAHLVGMALPDVALASTVGGALRVAGMPGRTVVFVHTRIRPASETISEAWLQVPGAEGCTSEACAFRDQAALIDAAGARIVGLSAQTPAEQAEAAKRLRLQYPLVSDEAQRVARALKLPTFAYEGRSWLRRLTLVVDDGRISHVFYPVFPPDKHAAEVYAWLQKHQR